MKAIYFNKDNEKGERILKKKNYLLLSVFMILTILTTACGKGDEKKETGDAVQLKENKVEENITVAAAASLTDAFNETKSLFKDKEGIDIDFTYGASGTLQKQIEEGAEIDLFVSASKKNMNNLVEGKLIDEDSVEDVVKNSLVLIVPKDSNLIKTTDDLNKLTKDQKIAVGEPETVPAGQYAKQSLENLELWDSLMDKYVFGKDVRQVLSYVERNEAEAGFVYSSDTIGVDNIKIAEIIESSNHDPIVYPAGVTSESKKKDAAKKFLKYLNTEEAKEILSKYGFIVD